MTPNVSLNFVQLAIGLVRRSSIGLALVTGPLIRQSSSPTADDHGWPTSSSVSPWKVDSLPVEFGGGLLGEFYGQAVTARVDGVSELISRDSAGNSLAKHSLRPGQCCSVRPNCRGRTELAHAVAGRTRPFLGGKFPFRALNWRSISMMSLCSSSRCPITSRPSGSGPKAMVASSSRYWTWIRLSSAMNSLMDSGTFVEFVSRPVRR